MPFKVVRRLKEIVLNQVIEGSNRFGDGLSCHPEWLLDATTVINFLDFIRKHKKPEEDETQILLDLFPEEAKQIALALDLQAKAKLQGKVGPLEDRQRLDKLKPFEDEDDD